MAVVVIVGAQWGDQGKAVDLLPENAQTVVRWGGGSHAGHAKAAGPLLPARAAAHIARVSELVGVPVWVTSVGPSRSETIIDRNPFVSTS